MKKTVLLLSISVSLYANNDYVPFSEFSEDQKIEYKFDKINQVNQIIEKKEIPRKTTIRTYKKDTKENISKKMNLRKPIVENNIKEINHTKRKSKLTYNKNILYSAQLIYSPLTTTLEDNASSITKKTNAIEVSLKAKAAKNTFYASYFKNNSEINSVKLDTSWAKLGYKYQIRKANIGLNINYVKNSEELKEIFPSLALDFENKSENIDLNYGFSLGKNSEIDYAYEYFFKVGIKTALHQSSRFVLGYKNRTIKDDGKLELKGPFIGINTTF